MKRLDATRGFAELERVDLSRVDGAQIFQLLLIGNGGQAKVLRISRTYVKQEVNTICQGTGEVIQKCCAL